MFVPARWFYAGRQKSIRLIVVHCTVSPEMGSGAEDVARYFANITDPRKKASAHRVADNDSVVECVRDADTAFGAAGANADGLHLELVGQPTQTRDEWLDQYSTHELALGRAVVDEWSQTYDIPKRWLTVAEVADGVTKGVTTHADVSKAFPLVSCVTADTPILCADLTWRPAGDLLPGDELIGFEADHVRQTGRRLQRSLVVRNSVERDVLLRVNTTRGSIRCNPEHPWLIRKPRPSKWGKWQWCRTDELEPGYEAMFVVEPWQTDRSWEAGWLAGMYDGEGCLTKAPARPGESCQWHTGNLSCHQRVSPTADMMLALLKERTDWVRVHIRRGREGDRQDLVQAVISKRTEIMRMLGTVRPPRLLEKADMVWDGASLGRTKDDKAVIESIEPAGTGLIASLSTSTQTYIAGGFAMHNTGHWDPGPNFPGDVFLSNAPHDEEDIVNVIRVRKKDSLQVFVASPATKPFAEANHEAGAQFAAAFGLRLVDPPALFGPAEDNPDNQGKTAKVLVVGDGRLFGI